MFHFCLKVLVYVLIFPFFISLTNEKKKKLSQGHPYNFRLPLQLFFPQVFQFSLQTEKTVGTAYLGVYCPSFYLNQS